LGNAYLCWNHSSRIFQNKITILVVAALLVTGIDLLIEQVAPKLDFWQFEGGPDLQNYLSWIGVSLSHFFFTLQL
jgi:putative membrane protein